MRALGFVCEPFYLASLRWLVCHGHLATSRSGINQVRRLIISLARSSYFKIEFGLASELLANNIFLGKVEQPTRTITTIVVFSLLMLMLI